MRRDVCVLGKNRPEMGVFLHGMLEFMNTLLKFVDILAALWLIAVGVVMSIFSPFLADAPGSSIFTMLIGWLMGVGVFAGPPLIWIIGRIIMSRIKKGT